MKLFVAIPFVVCVLALVLWGSSCAEITKPPDGVDTTSHDFTWETFTLGDGAGSVLRDVAIINDTLAYAVGEIRVMDSTGEWDPNIYNLAKWDGTDWTLMRVTVNFRGGFITPPLYAVFVFSSTDIWFSAGVPIHGDGENWTQYHLFDMGILTQNDGALRKIWGVHSSNLYFVGDKGTIVRHTNGTWQKLESGTTLDIQDIWGAYNSNGWKIELEVIAVASNLFQDAGKDVLKIEGVTVTKQSTDSLGLYYSGVWFVPSKKYYIAGGKGSGIFSTTIISTTNVWLPEYATVYYLESINGEKQSDIMASGHGGEIVHWNGVSWYSYRSQTAINGVYESVVLRKNLALAVGYEQQRAVIAVGRR